jgi:superfamily II DNA or RNA helicase
MPEYANLRTGRQMIVLVHRDELVWQTRRKLEAANPTLRVGIEKATHRDDGNSDLIVASVQTIGRNKYTKETQTYEWCDRIQKFDRCNVDVVVIDEAHHALGDSYRSVLAYFGILKDTRFADRRNECYLLGVTATPNRGDNLGLETVFDEIVYSKPIVEMIREGWLVEPHGHRVDTHVDLSAVKVTHGDFAIKELEKTVNTPARNKLIVKKYLELGEGLRAIAFTVDVQHSEDLAAEFNAEGVPAFALSGKTPDELRKQVLRDFHEGRYSVLASCGILNEGFDDPGVTVGLMARPTKSGLLYRQQVGRALRPFPAPEELAEMRSRGVEPEHVKQKAIIIDFCDVSSRHELHTVPTLFGLKSTMSLQGRGAVETVDEMERIAEQTKLKLPISSFDSIDALRSTATRINLLEPPKVPDHVRKVSPYSWLESGEEQFSLSLPKPDYAILRVQQNMLGQWEVCRSIKGLSKVLATKGSMETALREAEKHIPQEAKALLDDGAAWKRRPISDNQIATMWKYERSNVKSEFHGNFNQYANFMKERYPHQGAASDYIGSLLQSRKAPPKWLQDKINKNRASKVA